MLESWYTNRGELSIYNRTKGDKAVAGKKRRKYCIYTLNANKMADMYRSQEGCFDLNSFYVRGEIMLADDNLYSDSALFDQVMFALDSTLGRDARSGDVTTHLVYLQFENGIWDDAKAAALFEDGFKIIFEGEKEVRSFCSFDKSASMSRDNTISFIDETIFEEVDRRIGLDIDFTTISLTPSKYYSYRGLYMTEGIPVTVWLRGWNAASDTAETHNAARDPE